MYTCKMTEALADEFRERCKSLGLKQWVVIERLVSTWLGSDESKTPSYLVQSAKTGKVVFMGNGRLAAFQVRDDAEFWARETTRQLGEELVIVESERHPEAV